MTPKDSITPDRKKVADLLNVLLADEYLLYTKTRHAHWNVTGPNFMALHTFFQSQYELLDKLVDELAERVRSIGHPALGKMKDFLDVTRLKEDTKSMSETEVLKALVADHENIIINIRKEINIVNDNYKDAGTADFITGLMEQHEKMAWMLRAHLK